MLRAVVCGIGLAAFAGCSTDHDTPPSPLHIVSITPAGGTTDVETNVTIEVIFTVAVAPETVEGTNQIILQDQSFKFIAGVAAVDDDDPTRVTFSPTQALADGTTFGFAVRNGVATPNGERIAAPMGVQFSTGSTIAPMPGWPPFDDPASLPPVPGTFVRSKNELATGRRNMAAVALTDGRIFVHGGRGTTGAAIGTAEQYRPVSDDFAAIGTGSAPVARWGHRAVLLGNGQVLLIGGDTGTSVLADTPLFDPATNSYPTPATSLTTARTGHTATVLADGRVLVSGGWDGTNALASCEVYDPSTGTWQVFGSLATARAWHTATLLNDGRVLACGGFDGTNSLASAETFSPSAGNWTGSGAMAGTRDRHTATLLSSGTFAGLVFVCGGQQAGGSPTSAAELFDPAGNTGVGTFTSASSQMTVARTGHTATFLPASGRVLIAGGSSLALPATTGSCGALATAELWDPAGNAGVGGLPTAGGAAGAALQGTFTQTADPDGTATTMQAVNQGRAAHVAFRLGDGRVILIGGTDCNTAGSPYALPTGERYIP